MGEALGDRTGISPACSGKLLKMDRCSRHCDGLRDYETAGPEQTSPLMFWSRLALLVEGFTVCLVVGLQLMLESRQEVTSFCSLHVYSETSQLTGGTFFSLDFGLVDPLQQDVRKWVGGRTNPGPGLKRDTCGLLKF